MQRGLVLHLCRSFITLFLLAGSLIGNTDADPTNSTIDDSNPAFSFVGQNWNTINPSSPCDWCATKLDPSLTYNSTWHNGASVGLAGTFQFEGTAVYLYGATVGTSTAEIAFTIDNGPPTNYDLNTVSQSVSHMYNVLLFSSAGLSNGKHTLSWTLTPVTGPAAFASASGHVALIDYAIVSSDNESPPALNVESPPSSAQLSLSNSAIAGAVTPVSSAGVSTSGSSSSGSAQGGTSRTLNTLGSNSPTSISSFQAELGSVSILISPASATVTISASASAPENSADTSTTGNGPSQSHVHLVVAGAVGSSAGAILILCIILFIRRKRYLDRHAIIDKFDLMPNAEGGRSLTHHTGTIYPPEKSLAYTKDFEGTDDSAHSSQQSSTSSIESDSTDENDQNHQMQEMNERIAMLEMMVQLQKSDRPISLTSPPPY